MDIQGTSPIKKNVFGSDLVESTVSSTKGKDDLSFKGDLLIANIALSSLPKNQINVTKIDDLVLNDQLKTLQGEIKDIEVLVDKVISPDKINKIKENIERVGDELTRKILLVDDKSLMLDGMNCLNDCLLLLDPMIIDEGISSLNLEFQLSVVGSNIVSRVGTIVAIALLINRVSDVIKAKKEALGEGGIGGGERGTLQNEIDKLEKWRALAYQKTNVLLESGVINSALSIPKTIAAILSLATQSNSIFMSILGFLGMGTSIIGSALDWRKSAENLNTYKNWVSTIQKKDSDNIDMMLAKQKEIFESRLEKNWENLDKLLESIHQELSEAEKTQDKDKLEEIVDRLAKSGIVIPEENHTFDGLQTYLSDPSKRMELNVMMVKNKEALPVSLRNAIKTSIEKKRKLDKGFLSLILNKAKATFFTASVLTGLIITLKVLAIVGIAAAGVAAAVLGYGFLLLAIGFMVGGAIYLYVKKPNLFKTYLQGIQAKLFLWKIPFTIQSYQKAEVQLKIGKVSAKIAKIANMLKTTKDEKLKNNKKLKNKMSKKEDNLKVLEEKLFALNKSIAEIEQKMNQFRNTIYLAGWKDFQRHLLNRELPAKVDEKGHIIHQKQETEDDRDDSEALADYILNDAEFLTDPATSNLLSFIGVDIEKIKQNLEPINKDETMRQEIAKMIRAFFGMDASDTIEMINQKRSGIV